MTESAKQPIFVLNAWYVAGWARDLGESSLEAVTIAGSPLVLFRNSSGEPVALIDRCPHRWAPLSMGRLEGDTLRCMYHGIRFDSRGRCVEVPEQDGALQALSARCFPAVERHDLIWVWMGDPELAQPSMIPELWFLGDAARFEKRVGQMDYQAGYLQVCNNLLDLSHVGFLHENSLAGGATETSRTEVRVTAISRGVRTSYWRKGRGSSNVRRGADGRQTDVFNCFDLVAPGVFSLRSRAYPLGTAETLREAEPPEDMPTLLDDFSGQAVTPMTGRTSRYFFSHCIARDAGPDRLEHVWPVVLQAFSEDRRMIEAQQRVIDEYPGDRMLRIKADQGIVLFARAIDQLVAEEQSGRRSPEGNFHVS